MASITLDAVTKRFGNVTVVDRVSLGVRDGEFLVLLGPSGCGKTTTLRMVAGLEAVSEGTIRIGDQEAQDLHPADRDVAMVFQNYALYPHMNVFDNMAYGLRRRGMPRAEIDQQVRSTARMLQIEPYLGRRPAQLSGGQRQRVALGRAIVRHPKAFLMDEPLSNLDAKLRVDMRQELIRLHGELGVTTIYVTHDQVEAMTMGDRIAVMDGGKVRQLGPPLELYRQPASLFVASFLGTPSIDLLPGEITSSGGEARVSGPGYELVWPGPLAEPSARGVILGIRPQDLRLEPPTGGRAGLGDVTVEIVEHLGAESFALVRHAVGSLTAEVATGVSIPHGTRLPLSAPHDRILLFDEVTGDLLGGGDPRPAP